MGDVFVIRIVIISAIKTGIGPVKEGKVEERRTGVGEETVWIGRKTVMDRVPGDGVLIKDGQENDDFDK